MGFSLNIEYRSAFWFRLVVPSKLHCKNQLQWKVLDTFIITMEKGKGESRMWVLSCFLPSFMHVHRPGMCYYKYVLREVETCGEVRRKSYLISWAPARHDENTTRIASSHIKVSPSPQLQHLFLRIRVVSASEKSFFKSFQEGCWL